MHEDDRGKIRRTVSEWQFRQQTLPPVLWVLHFADILSSVVDTVVDAHLKWRVINLVHALRNAANHPRSTEEFEKAFVPLDPECRAVCAELEKLAKGLTIPRAKIKELYGAAHKNKRIQSCLFNILDRDYKLGTRSEDVELTPAEYRIIRPYLGPHIPGLVA